MTAAYVQTEPACPRCGGAMWNQKAGKFPYKPGTPIYKCKTKECASNGGVTWEPKTTITTTVSPKAPVTYAASKPQEQLPPFLQDAEAQDSAELAAKIGFDISKVEKDLAIYQALTEWVLKNIAPLYSNTPVGWTPESATAAVATLYIQAKRTP